MKKLLPILAFLSILLPSCEKEYVDEITNYDEAKLTITIGNAVTVADQTFTFTASNKWHTTIETIVTKADALWLSVSPSSGDAGTHTLTFTATENTSPNARTAIVKIICGTATVSLQLTQEGKENVTIPDDKQIYSMERIWNGETMDMTYYEYDENIKTPLGTPFLKSLKSKYYDTRISKEGNIINVVQNNKYKGVPEFFTCYLDNNSRVYRMDENFEHHEYQGTYLNYIYMMSYDAAGYLIERKEYQIYDNGEEVLNYIHRYEWENGNNTNIFQDYMLGTSYINMYLQALKTLRILQ